MRSLPLVAAAWSIALVLPAIAQDDAQSPGSPENEPLSPRVDVPALIHVRSERDVVRVRRELIGFIWKNGGELPKTSAVVRADAEWPERSAPSPTSTESFIVVMDEGFRSLGYLLRPEGPTKRLALFHQGHEDDWTRDGGRETVEFLLESGYAVIVLQMPLYGDNKRLAPLGIESHDAMLRLASRKLEPIKLFLEPIRAALSYAEERFAPEDVVMLGLSGGAWATTLYAAVDPRIRLSVPVAGTQPDYLRTALDWGDWEQTYPELYEIANFLDLYVLGASGPGRWQRQVLNRYDSCCFSGVGFRTYERHVAAAVRSIGPGSFDVYLDESHRSHLVSRDTRTRAIAPLLQAPSANGP